MTEKALTAVIQEAYIQGVSTHSVDALVQAMDGTGISKSEVSRLCEEIDGRVQAFLTRLIEGEWPWIPYFCASCATVNSSCKACMATFALNSALYCTAYGSDSSFCPQ